MDRKIRNLVLEFNRIGITTTGSCEGHLLHGSPSPWVKVTVQNREVGKKIEEKAQSLIDSFYTSRRGIPRDARFTITKAKNGFWIHNGGAAFARWRRLVDENASRIKQRKEPRRSMAQGEIKSRQRKLKTYQEEIRRFARFIKDKSIAILFIGNSFSYYHDLPNLVAGSAKDSGFVNVTIDGVFRGRATLKTLWQDKRTVKKINSRHWDYIVIQERGRLGGKMKNNVIRVGDPKEFFEYAAKFNEVIKKNGAKTVLYCPPSFIGTGLFEDAKKLDAAFVEAGKKLHAIVVRSGIAFMSAIKKQPGLNLFGKDGHHPSPLGTYLIAALFCRKVILANRSR